MTNDIENICTCSHSTRCSKHYPELETEGPSINEEQLSFLDELMNTTDMDKTDVYVAYTSKYGVDGKQFEQFLDLIEHH